MSDPYPKPLTDRPAGLPVVLDGEIFQSVGKYSRSAVLFAFEQIGGPVALAHWADKNPDEFYTKLFPKIIARESEVTHHRSVDQLMDVIDGDFAVDGEIEDVDFDPRAGEPQNLPDIPELAPNWNTRDISDAPTTNVSWPEDATQSVSPVDLVEVGE